MTDTVSAAVDTERPGAGAGWISDYTWFIGRGLGFVLFLPLERTSPVLADLDREPELASDGRQAETAL